VNDTDPHPLPAYRRWPVSAGPAWLADPIAQCLILLAVTSAFFLAVPGVDVWFSRLFYLDGTGFVMARLTAFLALRELHQTLTWLVPVLLIVGLLVKLAFPWRESLVSPRDALFVIGTLIVGPGIVANLIFKDNWGRPRPTAILPFGGEHAFVPAWQISDACATNCSFISGEGSSAIWLVTFAVLLHPRWRAMGLKVLFALAAAFSLNRIAFGGHFLSDVLIAWWINLAIFAALYRLLYERPPAALAEETLDAGLGSAGVAIRRLISRATS
jgi:membrane-associated PAP2 superfamily phosphatase